MKRALAQKKLLIDRPIRLISDGLLFELAPILKIGKRLDAAVYLQAMLQGEGYKATSEARRLGLLLCAINFHVARRVLEDLKRQPSIPPVERWQRGLSSGSCQIKGHKLTWSEADATERGPLPATRQYLSRLPLPLVKRVIAGAPPVVNALSDDRAPRVVANHVTAFLAHQLCSDKSIPVRQLAAHTGMQRSFPAICCAIVAVMQRLYEQYHSRIPAAAGDLKTALVLTDFKRSRCAELLGDVA